MNKDFDRTLTCDGKVFNGHFKLQLGFRYYCTVVVKRQNAEIPHAVAIDENGTSQVNRDGRAVTFIRFRIHVKAAGDGLATYGNTTLSPTPLETESCELMKRRMSEPLSEQRLAALRAMGKQDDASESC
jgi:hypothetical protein